MFFCFFFFSSRRRHTRSLCDWSSDVCSSDLGTKISCVFSFWPECGNLQRVNRIKLRQQLFGGAKLLDREDECTQHPRIGGAQILRLILERRLELELARRKHSGVINRAREQGA